MMKLFIAHINFGLKSPSLENVQGWTFTDGYEIISKYLKEDVHRHIYLISWVKVEHLSYTSFYTAQLQVEGDGYICRIYLFIFWNICQHPTLKWLETVSGIYDLLHYFKISTRWKMTKIYEPNSLCHATVTISNIVVPKCPSQGLPGTIAWKCQVASFWSTNYAPHRNLNLKNFCMTHCYRCPAFPLMW